MVRRRPNCSRNTNTNNKQPPRSVSKCTRLYPSATRMVTLVLLLSLFATTILQTTTVRNGNRNAGATSISVVAAAAAATTTTTAATAPTCFDVIRGGENNNNNSDHNSDKKEMSQPLFTRGLKLSSVPDNDTTTTTNDQDQDTDPVPKNRIGEFEESIGFYQAIELIDTKPKSLLYTTQSPYQSIEVYQTKFFGKMLVLDDVIQLTERDGDSYNEMMAHVPMFQHPHPQRVLVIGGGDGYVLKEVLKHPSVVHVDHVDLDAAVIRTCQDYFPQWGDAWQDPRAHLHIYDGAQFVREAPDQTYDVIIQDSSDPWTVDDDGSIQPLPSGVLYEREHFQALHRILKPDGIVNVQAESFNVPTSLRGILDWQQIMAEAGFARIRYGSIQTTSYPTGQLGFLLGEKQAPHTASVVNLEARYQHMIAEPTNMNDGDNDDDSDNKKKKQKRRTTYYHPPLQTSCFDLPLWVHDTLYGSKTDTESRSGATTSGLKICDRGGDCVL